MTSLLPSAAMPFISSSTASSIELPGTLSRRSAPCPSPRRTRSTAVATYHQNRTGSLSSTSSVTQANAASRPEHQARTAVVLPYPAGAATSVSATSSSTSRACKKVLSLDHAPTQGGGSELRLDQRGQRAGAGTAAPRFHPLSDPPGIRRHHCRTSSQDCQARHHADRLASAVRDHPGEAAAQATQERRTPVPSLIDGERAVRRPQMFAARRVAARAPP